MFNRVVTLFTHLFSFLYILLFAAVPPDYPTLRTFVLYQVSVPVLLGSSRSWWWDQHMPVEYLAGLGIGCHFSALSLWPQFSSFTLSEQLDLHSPVHLVTLTSCCSLLIFVTHYNLLRVSRRLQVCALCCVAAGAGTAAVYTVASLPTRGLHIHHYLVGAYVVLVSRRKTKFAHFCRGIGWGVYADGVACWGYATPLPPLPLPQETQTVAASN